MGVEYEHCLFVRDLTWVGGGDMLARLHQVFARWQLAPDAPTVIDLDTRKKTRDLAKIAGHPGRNLLAEWPDVEGVPTIAEVMGPSFYPQEQIGPRYFQRVYAVVGTNFQVMLGPEAFTVTVVTPPLTRGKPAAPFEDNRLGMAAFQTYPAERTSVPPVAHVSADRRSKRTIPVGFTGVWRAGLILDCGKDLPAFADKRSTLPNDRFVADVTSAFGADLVEVGFFC